MSKAMEIPTDQLRAILMGEKVTPLHQVVDDRRLKSFITIEEFERKWSHQLTPKKNITEEAKNTYTIGKDEAKKVYDKLGYTFDFEEFHKGINVEMEHKDVTGGDITTTAKVAAAHLRENPKYYTLLQKYVEKPK